MGPAFTEMPEMIIKEISKTIIYPKPEEKEDYFLYLDAPGTEKL